MSARPLEDTTRVHLTVFELGYLLGLVYDRAKATDPTAQGLYRKLKEAAIAAGVEWYYGDPPEAKW